MISTNNNELLHTFAVDITAEGDKTRYRGTFTSKKMSIKDMTKVGVLRTQLCEGLHFVPEKPGTGIDFHTFSLNSMLAHLQLAITDSPDWWDLDALTDLEVLYKVYEEVASFENTFHGSRSTSSQNGNRGSGQGDSSSSQVGPDPAGVVEQVVAGQVSPSLDP